MLPRSVSLPKRNDGARNWSASCPRGKAIGKSRSAMYKRGFDERINSRSGTERGPPPRQEAGRKIITTGRGGAWPADAGRHLCLAMHSRSF